ncbi:MAG: hypothetical protein ACOC85_05585, partial [Thermoplasmatota archaeon]
MKYGWWRLQNTVATNRKSYTKYQPQLVIFGYKSTGNCRRFIVKSERIYWNLDDGVSTGDCITPELVPLLTREVSLV